MGMKEDAKDELARTVIAARDGDLEAFSELVARFQDMAVGYAHSILGDFHAAEDAAQEAFVEVLRSFEALREPRAFPGWFRRIVFKHSDRIARKRSTSPKGSARTAGAGSDPSPGADEVLVSLELREAVLDRLRDLPEHERSVVTLFYIHDCTHREIAEFEEVPVSTVKTRLHSARKRLRDSLDAALHGTLEPHRPSRDARFQQRVLQLAFASYYGDVERAEEVLRRSPELVNAEFSWFWYWRWTGTGWRPLHRAAEQRQNELCVLLLERGADPNATQAECGWTPLHMAFGHAADAGSRETAELLIRRGARVDAFAAAALGDVEQLSRLDVRAPCPEGATPLHFAGTAEAVSHLVELGIEPDTRCARNGATPLRWLLAHGRERAAIEALLGAGAAPALTDAVAYGDADLVAPLLARAPEALSEPFPARALVAPEGDQLLHLASNRGHGEVVALLLGRGAEPNARGFGGALPLSRAAFNAQPRVARVLLEHGADPNALDASFGSSALFTALLPSVMPWQDRAALRETLALLIDAGARPEEPNREGISARALLESRGQNDLVEYLDSLVA